jgi:ribosomal subunit interface protein
MRVSIVARHRVGGDTRAYAEQRLRRLERHAALHDASLTIDREASRVPEASAEVVVHMHHIRLAARCEAPNVREAIDGAVNRADEQVRRRQERVAVRKGRSGADARPPHS